MTFCHKKGEEYKNILIEAIPNWLKRILNSLNRKVESSFLLVNTVWPDWAIVYSRWW